MKYPATYIPITVSIACCSLFGIVIEIPTRSETAIFKRSTRRVISIYYILLNNTDAL